MIAFFGGFSAKKLKPQLKMAVSRFTIASNKKSAIMKQQMREIAIMLSEEPPKEEKAKIRAESLIREDSAIEAYEILQLLCELIAERIKLIESQKECPPDLVSSIATLIWATDRCDIPELEMIRKQFRSKYGSQFVENSLNNVSGCLNERIVSKLSVQPPAAYLVQTYLEKISDQFDVGWKPTIKVAADQMGEPMAAPVGYSVQVAQGTGLAGAHTSSTVSASTSTGTPRTTSQSHSNHTTYEEPVHFPQAPGAKKEEVPAIFAILPVAPDNTENNNNNDHDFGEVDIFVPAISAAPSTDMTTEPTAPSAETPTNQVDDRMDDDSEDESNSSGGGSGAVASSYSDLASRFEALNK